MLIALLLVTIAGCAPPAGESSAAPSVLLVTLDTTIPGALSCYGAPVGTTPHFDALAEEGVLFENARTVAPMTLPAHCSMLTGLYPVRHTVRVNGSNVLPDDASTLAERAREKGMRTAAFLASDVLDPAFGLAQGFELYDDPPATPATSIHETDTRPADEIADRTIAWLEALEADERFFAWAHFFDPHHPYQPPSEFRERCGDAYRGEVAFVDHHVGRILATLKEIGREHNTVVVVVGDHGEGLGRHGETQHAAFAFDTTLRVPLIVRLPGRAQAGRRSDAIVSVADLHPTLLRAVDLGLPGDVDGRDVLADDLDPARGVYFETYYGLVSFGWSHITGWVDTDGKYLHSSSPEFFDPVTDPGEERNLIHERRDEVEKYRAWIQRVSDRERLAPQGMQSHDGAALTAQLEKLGYASAGSQEIEIPEPLARLSWCSPHSRIESYRDMRRAMHQSETGKAAAAIPTLLRLQRENPRNYAVGLRAGLLLIKSGRAAEAIEPLSIAVYSRTDDWLVGHTALAAAFDGAGRIDDAIRSYEHVARLSTAGTPGCLDRLVALLKKTGQMEKARRYEGMSKRKKPATDRVNSPE